MLKSDLKLIADFMRECKPTTSPVILKVYWQCQLDLLCTKLKEDNPRFDKDQFLSACGYQYPTEL